MHEVTEVRFELISGNEVPAGRACRITETDGVLVVQIRDGHHHASPELCHELNALHRSIIGEGDWAQTPFDTPDRVDQPPTRLGIADVRWEIDSAGELPPRVVCFPLEAEGRFTWLVAPGHASAQLCDEMNAYLERIAGDGLWVQCWASAETPAQPV